MSDEWGLHQLDLPAYLARIGQRSGGPDGTTLARLHRAHVRAIGFENLDVVLGRDLGLDLDAVQDKLVARGRGGYCYEHGLLFAAVLEALGFGVDRLLARVGHHPDRPGPRTHLALRVTGLDGTWLADVGFGAGLLEPMPWIDGARARQGGWTYRFVGDGDGDGQLQMRGVDGWESLYTAATDTVHASDIEVANHFTATHPSSPFVGRLIVLPREEHELARLLDRTLETTAPDASATSREISDDELPAVLRDRFHIAIGPDEVTSLRAQSDSG